MDLLLTSKNFTTLISTIHAMIMPLGGLQKMFTVQVTSNLLSVHSIHTDAHKYTSDVQLRQGEFGFKNFRFDMFPHLLKHILEIEKVNLMQYNCFS